MTSVKRFGRIYFPFFSNIIHFQALSKDCVYISLQHQHCKTARKKQERFFLFFLQEKEIHGTCSPFCKGCTNPRYILIKFHHLRLTHMSHQLFHNFFIRLIGIFSPVMIQLLPDIPSTYFILTSYPFPHRKNP